MKLELAPATDCADTLIMVDQPGGLITIIKVYGFMVPVKEVIFILSSVPSNRMVGLPLMALATYTG